jgi:thioredoxin reductase
MASSVDVIIVGAGPYGLSLAAHLRLSGVDFRIFGEPMGAWKQNMPPGILLKSYPWATNLSDPEATFTVKKFCADRGLPYSDYLMPLSLEAFVSYGEAFQARFVPPVERKMLVRAEPDAGGICARFDDGEVVRARRMVVAVGLSAFKYLPPIAERLPSDLISHSADYGPLGKLAGKRVAIIGSGSSATDLSALLHEQGADVSLVTRAANLEFGAPPRPRGLFERAIAPMGPIGNGWSMGIYANAPALVHLLPEALRLRLAYPKALGPLGGAYMKERVIEKVRLQLGCEIERAEVRSGVVKLHLTAAGGDRGTLTADHVIFATGYKADVTRLDFFDPELKRRIRLTGVAPTLSNHYETSIDGLHFIGPAAAPSFGPVCRFVQGARYPAHHLAKYLPAALSRRASPANLFRWRSAGVSAQPAAGWLAD